MQIQGYGNYELVEGKIRAVAPQPAPTKVQIVKQNNGNCVAIGLKGSPQDIDRMFWGFRNWKGIDCELEEISENFKYFWANADKLKAAMITQTAEILASPEYKGREGGVIDYAKDIVASEMASWPEEEFVVYDGAKRTRENNPQLIVEKSWAELGDVEGPLPATL